MHSPNQTAIEHVYLRPAEEIKRLFQAPLRIVLSAKFTRQHLVRNRYYMDLEHIDHACVISCLEELYRQLAMPEAAIAITQAEMDRLNEVRFVGVGENEGQISYRTYLGFFPEEAHKAYMTYVSIDWIPGTGQYWIKEYIEQRNTPPDTCRQMLRDSLLPSDIVYQGTTDREGLLAVCQALLEQSNCLRDVTRVSERSSRRLSAAFNYSNCRLTLNATVRPHLDAIATIFSIPQEVYAAWLHTTEDIRIIDVAAGCDKYGEPFVTVYHRWLDTPPPFSPPAATPLQAALV